MKELKGTGASMGKAHGRVKVIRNGEDHAKFNQGDILVTKITDPTMVVIMGKASGIICEIGSLVSHPSIVSREMGIPCIVAVEGATEHLRDNDVIHMCGTSGKIQLLDKPEWRLKWK